MTTGKQAAWGETGRLAGRVRIGGSPGALGTMRQGDAGQLLMIETM